ncbi:MAG: dihydrodipicolinate reductase [Planctomycetes bacterium]|nr:dihydrodipicolinate reductase [Planctomycetota bacterium]
MSGLPGRMAAASAEALDRSSGIELLPFALTGVGFGGSCRIGSKTVRLLEPEEREHFMEGIQDYNKVIIVDYSHPDAVLGNASFYASKGLPFVMGTTGGNLTRLTEIVQSNRLPAVVAPNMALPLVAIMAMFDFAAKNFPGVFQDYRLSIRESHQKGKADTSGTAKAMLGMMKTLGVSFDEDRGIEMCRDPELQKSLFNIPDEHLSGHAYHTYDISSEDGSSHFRIEHNILGRSIYAEGTVHAVQFLARHLDEKPEAPYSMIDVLKNL